ncbi:hypothetical protein GCM10010252_53440 [Streptomyces aureoverticillatus]|nr:hypothetical protein GCM10010252_53440 [Streptomyces aureoverticillatus]
MSRGTHVRRPTLVNVSYDWTLRDVPHSRAVTAADCARCPKGTPLDQWGDPELAEMRAPVQLRD